MKTDNTQAARAGRIHLAKQSVLTWIGRHDFATLISVLVALIGSWLFIEILDEVAEGDSAKFDEYLYESLHLVDVPGWYLQVWQDFTALGGISVLSLITVLVVVYLAMIKKFGAMWFFFVAVAGGLLVNTLLKELINRPRPGSDLHLTHIMSPSFPSGHAMLSATAYMTLGALLARMYKRPVLKAYFILSAALLTGIIGVSRVMLGVHYPTDVLAGWILGTTWAVLCALAARALQRRGVVEQEGTAEPEIGDEDALDMEPSAG